MNHFRSSKLFSDASMTIIAIESVEIQHHEMAMDCQFYYGKVEPIAVIVFGSDSHSAFNMNARSSKMAAKRIHRYTTKDLLFIALGHGGVVPGLDVFLTYTKSNIDQN